MKSNLKWAMKCMANAQPKLWFRLRKLVRRGVIYRDLKSLKMTEKNSLPNVCLYTMPRSGSVLISKLVVQAGVVTGRLPVNIENVHHLYPDCRFDVEDSLIGAYPPKGYVFAPKRRPMPSMGHPDDQNIVFVRHPLDVAVSRFYAWTQSHILANEKMAEVRRTKPSIDEFVLLQLEQQCGAYQWLREKAALEGTLVVRYEDYRTDQEGAAWKIVEAIGLTRAQFESLDLSGLRVAEGTGDTKGHVRSGRSGQYLKELKKETLEVLRNAHQETLLEFGYGE